MKGKGKLVLIAADQTVTETEQDEPTLEDLQDAVGGYIEPVRVWWKHKPRLAYVNEYGKRLQLPHNARASYLLAHPFTGQTVCGNLIMWIKGEKDGKAETP